MQNQASENAAHQELISKVEPLEAEKLVTAASLRKAHHEIEVLRAQLEMCHGGCGVDETREAITESINYEASGQDTSQVF